MEHSNRRSTTGEELLSILVSIQNTAFLLTSFRGKRGIKLGYCYKDNMGELACTKDKVPKQPQG